MLLAAIYVLICAQQLSSPLAFFIMTHPESYLRARVMFWDADQRGERGNLLLNQRNSASELNLGLYMAL
jgi:hypothetical protein